MSKRDIVNQMSDEMGMNQQMLQNMQQQQLSQMPMAGSGMGSPMASVDFSQLNPDQQQMMMMQQALPQQHHQPPQQQQPVSDDYDSSSMTSSSSGSVEMDLDKLGLNVSRNKGFFDNILQYLRDPLIVIVIFLLCSLPQVDGLLKPLIPYGLAYGMYYLAIKGALAGLLYFAIKLVI